MEFCELRVGGPSCDLGPLLEHLGAQHVLGRELARRLTRWRALEREEALGRPLERGRNENWLAQMPRLQEFRAPMILRHRLLLEERRRPVRFVEAVDTPAEDSPAMVTVCHQFVARQPKLSALLVRSGGILVKKVRCYREVRRH